MNPRIKRAGVGEPTPAGMERVKVYVTGTAEVDVFMPAGLADSVDENDPMFADEVVQAGGEDLFAALDFEVDVLGAAEVAPAKKKGNG